MHRHDFEFVAKVDKLNAQAASTDVNVNVACKKLPQAATSCGIVHTHGT